MNKKDSPFKVGDKVRHSFDGGYIVTTIREVRGLSWGEFVYLLELPQEVHDDELLLWESEIERAE